MNMETKSATGNYQIHLTLSLPSLGRMRKVVPVIAVLAALLFASLGPALAFSTKLKSEGDAEYAKQNYASALLKYEAAKSWWLPEKISPKLRDRDLEAKTAKAEIMIESAENYAKGMSAFNKEQYPEAKRLLSLLAFKDPHYQAAQNTLKEIGKIEEDLSKSAKKDSVESISRVPNLPALTPTLTPQNKTQTPQTYPILSLNELATNYDQIKQYAYAIYDEFIKTPNLQYLTPDQQKDLFQQKSELYFKQLADQKLAALKEELNRKNEELNRLDAIPTPNSQLAVYVNQEVEAALANLKEEFNSVNSNPFISESTRKGSIDRAYQDWVGGNQSVYTIIAGTRYKNDLNAILTANGLVYYIIY